MGLAEISDKLPGLAEYIAGDILTAVFLGAVAIPLKRWGWVCLIPAIAYFYGRVELLWGDTELVPILIEEVGYGYFLVGSLAACLPMVGVLCGRWALATQAQDPGPTLPPGP